MFKLWLAILIGAWALTPPYDVGNILFGFSAGMFFQEWWIGFLRSRSSDPKKVLALRPNC